MSSAKIAQAKSANAELPDLPIWKSKVFIGGVVASLVALAQYFGLIAAVTPYGQEKVVDVIVAIVGGGGGLMAAIARVTQKTAPPLKII